MRERLERLAYPPRTMREKSFFRFTHSPRTTRGMLEGLTYPPLPMKEELLWIHSCTAGDAREARMTHVSTADDEREIFNDSRIHRGRYERMFNRFTYPPWTMGEKPLWTHFSTVDDARGAQATDISPRTMREEPLWIHFSTADDARGGPNHSRWLSLVEAKRFYEKYA